MGYTHYWRRSPESRTQKTWHAAVRDCERIICSHHGILIDREYDDKSHLAFNGRDGDSHETFVMPRQMGGIEEFAFCKTAYKPYDSVVIACLCRLGETGSLLLSSDGGNDDWKDGEILASRVLGRPVPIPDSI